MSQEQSDDAAGFPDDVPLPAGSKVVGPALIEMPEPLGIFAGELFDRASQYLRAFERLQAQDPKEDMYACYFLLAHALELFLKSYLAARGVPKKRLRQQKLRHNLPALYSLAEELHLPDLQHLKELVVAIHQMNDQHDFRYPTGFNLHVPSADLCMSVVRPLRDEMSRIVGAERARAQVTWAAETRHLKPFKIRWSD